MDPLYAKTAKGVREATGKTRSISREYRDLLKAIEGQVSAADLLKDTEGWSEDTLRRALGVLIADGYVRESLPAEPAAPASGALADLDFTMLPAEEAARREAEERARREAAEQAQREAEEQVKQLAREVVRRETRERARREAAEQARREAEERANRVAEEAARREAEERARREAAEKARLEAEAEAKRLAEEAQRRESAERLKREEAERARREAEETARRLAEEAAGREAEERTRREAAERAQREAEERARQIAEESARREAEERAQREAAEQARREAEAEAQRHAEEAAQRAAEERAGREAAEQARQEAEERGRQLAEEAARREAQARERAEAERARREAAEQARAEAEALARLQAEEAGRRASEERVKREAAEEARIEAEEAKRHAEAMKREAEERARREIEERTRREGEARERAVAEEAAQRRLDEQALRAEAREESRRTARERAERKAAERARRAAEKERERRTAQVVPRQGGKRFKALLAALVVMAAVALALLHLVPFDGRIPVFEQAIAARLGQPARIKSARFALLPQPHWRLADVEIGQAAQIRAPRVKAFTGLAALFDERAGIEGIAAEAPTLTAEGLRWLLFAAPGAGDVRFVRAKDLKLEAAGWPLPALEAEAEVGADGGVGRIGASSADGKFKLQLAAGADGFDVRIDAASMPTPFAGLRALEEFTGRGTLAADALSLAEFSGRALGGMLTGQARLGWEGAPRVEGELVARRVDAARLLPGLFAGGALDGKAAFSLALPGAAAAAGARLRGGFAVRDGAFATIDLARLLRGGGAGRMPFATLEGELAHEDGATRLRQLRLDAGALTARGSADIAADDSLQGQVAIELNLPNDRRRGEFAFTGGAAARRGEGIAWKRR